MNPLLRHTLDKLNKPNAYPTYIIGMSFMSLLEQAKDNPNINLNGGDSIDENTARPIQKKSIFKIPKHIFDYMPVMPDIPPISNVMTCRNRMLQNKRLPNCAEMCSLGFDKVPKLKRECEIPDCWL